MANKLFNLARVVTATTGTGTITLGAAVLGYLTFAQAGVANGDQVWYSIIDDNGNSEVGTGTYTASGTTLSRDTVHRSTGAGNTAKISLSGSAQVMVSVLAETFAPVALSGSASDLAAGTLPNARLSAVPNSALANSTVTVSGHSLSLGGSLALAAADVSGLAAVATSGSASDLASGTLPNARLVSVPNSALANSALTISGHSISLGGSYSLVPADISALAAFIGAIIHPGYVSGQLYGPPHAAAFGNNVMAINRLTATPWLVYAPVTFTEADCNVTTLAALGVMRLAIYSNTAGAPDALLLDCGSFSTTSTGAKALTGFTLTLNPGIYWIVTWINVQPTMTVQPVPDRAVGLLLSTTAPSGTSEDNISYFRALAYSAGSFPNPFGAGAYSASVYNARVVFKVQ